LARLELTIVVVITNHDFLHLAKLAHLAPDILIEGVKVILELLWVHGVFGVVRWVEVHV